MSTVVPTACPTCGAPVLPEESFCETCGTTLPAGPPVAGSPEAAPGGPLAAASGGPPVAGPPPAAVAPGPQTLASAAPSPAVCRTCGDAMAADGYCSTCGAPAVRERDHWSEVPAPWVAAVCDRGIRHIRNEDAVALAADPDPLGLAVLVVCDGVSSSRDPDVASLAAARSARDSLISARPQPGSTAGRVAAWAERISTAAGLANAAAVRVDTHGPQAPVGLAATFGGPRASPPSCTFVAAVVDGPVIVVGWVGDSRAYWLPDDGPPELLTIDDSWAAVRIAEGMPREQAETAPQAHAITRWLGVDSPDHEPHLATTTPTGAGWLLVCSDGLWNYCSAPSRMGELMAVAAAGAAGAVGSPLGTAEWLVEWANAQGGQDNISVALARWDRAAVAAST
jgi:serine/threonine protein phosphatase PrpC